MATQDETSQALLALIIKAAETSEAAIGSNPNKATAHANIALTAAEALAWVRAPAHDH